MGVDVKKPARVLNSGPRGVMAALAVLSGSVVYAATLNARIAVLMAMPELAFSAYNFLPVICLMPIFVLAEARPAGARHWGIVTAVAVGFQTVSTLVWWGAAGTLFHLAPDREPGLTASLFLALASGVLPYLAIQRLAGTLSPWRAEPESATGETPP